MRYDRARNNLDRHPNYILAAYMASGTSKAQDATCRSYAVPAPPPARDGRFSIASSHATPRLEELKRPPADPPYGDRIRASNVLVTGNIGQRDYISFA